MGTVPTVPDQTPAVQAAIAADPALRQADLRVVPASPGKAERLESLIAARRGCFYLNRLEAEILAGRACPDAATAAAVRRASARSPSYVVRASAKASCGSCHGGTWVTTSLPTFASDPSSFDRLHPEIRRWILENERFDEQYLRAPGAAAAAKIGEKYSP